METLAKMETDPSLQSRGDLLGRIYDIAIDPTRLKGFIETWHAASAAHDHDRFQGLEDDIGAHLERAQQFLGSGDLVPRDPGEPLKPYQNMSAFIVDATGIVLVANQGASESLGVHDGIALDQLRLDDEVSLTLKSSVQKTLRGELNTDSVFSGTLSEGHHSVLFRVSPVEIQSHDTPSALVVVSDLQWHDAIDSALARVFDLTRAERSIVQHLIKGRSTRDISRLRNVQETTLRGQIKSILGKMGLRSKTDIVRLVMPLAIIPTQANKAQETAPFASGHKTVRLEEEVWKPFLSFQTFGGRQLSYQEMGPANGLPILVSHMGSCMVRWPEPMLRLAYAHNLRVICPIRAGYGASDPHAFLSDVFAETRADTIALLDHLGIDRLPYASQGTDFPLAIDLAATFPNRISKVIGIGGRPCLPNGAYSEGRGDWQQFFVGAARQAPRLVRFAAAATMAMSRRLGSARMLRELCKDSPADLALLEDAKMAEVLRANLDIMADKKSDSAGSFAREFIAFYSDWSDRMKLAQNVPIQLFVAEEDPTWNFKALPAIKQAYPWINIEMVPNAGLALLFEHPKKLVGYMAQAAKRTEPILTK